MIITSTWGFILLISIKVAIIAAVTILVMHKIEKAPADWGVAIFGGTGITIIIMLIALMRMPVIGDIKVSDIKYSESSSSDILDDINNIDKLDIVLIEGKEEKKVEYSKTTDINIFGELIKFRQEFKTYAYIIPNEESVKSRLSEGSIVYRKTYDELLANEMVKSIQ